MIAVPVRRAQAPKNYAHPHLKVRTTGPERARRFRYPALIGALGLRRRPAEIMINDYCNGFAAVGRPCTTLVGSGQIWRHTADGAPPEDTRRTGTATRRVGLNLCKTGTSKTRTLARLALACSRRQSNSFAPAELPALRRTELMPLPVVIIIHISQRSLMNGRLTESVRACRSERGGRHERARVEAPPAEIAEPETARAQGV
jgi:hypothetical protein